MLSLLLTLCFSSVSFAQKPAKSPLVSPFASSVEGISIPNTHVVKRSEGVILRGMAPLTQKQVEELKVYGITDVLIFRNDVLGETGIADEIRLLEKTKLKVHTIPFRWKDISNFTEACTQTVQALRLIREVEMKKGRGLFFHCTVGEDRTGYLAGLYRILFEKVSSAEAFKTEMCGRGYAEGDYKKPPSVVKVVHSNVTPLFYKMVQLIESGRLSEKKFDEAACVSEPKLLTPKLPYTCPRP